MLTLRSVNGTKGMGNHPSTEYITDGYCLQTLLITVTIQKIMPAV